ncbi:DUF2570 family protein [Pasteurella multocida]|uniref:DUF2570 family protein n=1 Tax=Pasteurella multocida TaxID=747 RepID=UPI00064C55EB|nr:DUF2570 family protein [Pasteurella multocida]KLT48619.1 hypothetical protein PVACC_02515 [Pasteurella multocida subsp. multocida]KLT52935.1 hypothetical protein PMMV1_02515 [Pasteurella multocida subsp. multocida]KLT58298.1 hypothetical protein ISLM_02510 [Pasteurella multocida subsp. multocida]KLT62938.1 hypothetical protein PESH_02515 [Pasteurella multocida subsp. multocida]KLU28316.1 hypothetical protein ATTK_11165 [Pasteurella multocida subsp. multocida]
MFTFINKAYIAIIALLGAVIAFQYYSIVSLEDKTKQQAQMIESQSESIKSLKLQEELNQKLTLEISRLESESRSKSDEAINSISHDEKSTDAYNASAPRSIIDFLRK